MRNLPNVIIILFINLILTGCKGCLNRFYQVHEQIPYLNISPIDSNISSKAVLNYLDSYALRDTLEYSLVTSFNKDTLYKTERVIYFKYEPEEYYRINCDALPCRIMGVFNRKIDSEHWVFDSEKLTPFETERIEKRFKISILDKIK